MKGPLAESMLWFSGLTNQSLTSLAMTLMGLQREENWERMQFTLLQELNKRKVSK